MHVTWARVAFAGRLAEQRAEVREPLALADAGLNLLLRLEASLEILAHGGCCLDESSRLRTLEAPLLALQEPLIVSATLPRLR